MAGIRLEWAQFGDFDSFDVLRSNAPMDINALPSPLATGLPTMMYVDTAVTDGATYYYRVVAWRDGVSKVSSEIKCVAGDEYWANVTLLSNMSTSTTESIIVDAKGHTFTGLNATIADDGFALDGKSLLLSSGYISTPYSTGFAFDADFTAEIRFKYSTHQQYGGILCCAQPVSNWLGWNIIFDNSSDNLRVEINRTLVIVSSITLTANTYHHVALCRSSGVVRLFIDGAIVGSANYSESIDSGNAPLYIGVEREGNLKVAGNFDEVRITKGIARYIENFTPPGKPFLSF